MQELEGVCVGDLHLNAYRFLSNYVEDPDDMVYKMLDKVVAYCRDNSIEYLFLLGDIFDNPNPDQDSQKRFLRYCRKCGLQVFVIIGNHDQASDGVHSLVVGEFYAEDIKDNLHVYTVPTLVEVSGIPFSFLPWPHKKPLTKGPCINVAHITLKGAKSDSGTRLTKGEEIKMRKNQYWFIGDVHQQQQHDDLHYVGTPMQKTFGERLPKGFSHFTAQLKDGKLTVNDNFIIHKPPFELVTLKIDEPDDFQKIEPLNKDYIKLYKLKLGKDVVLPKTLFTDFPNVFTVEYDGKKRVVQYEGKKVTLQGVADPLKGLRRALMKEGLTKAEAYKGYLQAKAGLKRLEA